MVPEAYLPFGFLGLIKARMFNKLSSRFIKLNSHNSLTIIVL
jgi:hypothetical protein